MKAILCLIGLHKYDVLRLLYRFEHKSDTRPYQTIRLKRCRHCGKIKRDRY